MWHELERAVHSATYSCSTALTGFARAGHRIETLTKQATNASINQIKLKSHSLLKLLDCASSWQNEGRGTETLTGAPLLFMSAWRDEQLSVKWDHSQHPRHWRDHYEHYRNI
jgi:hypothetical protein